MRWRVRIAVCLFICELLLAFLTRPRVGVAQALLPPQPAQMGLPQPKEPESISGEQAISKVAQELAFSPQPDAPQQILQPRLLPPGETPPAWSSPSAKPGEEVLPVSLPAALRLANVRAWDIAIATQQLRVAAAQYEGTKVLWLPNVIAGTYYAHHDGPIQANDGSVTDSTRSSLAFGVAPLGLISLTDAIFSPLAQRQVVRAQEANVQTATNDLLASVAIAYFDAQEARADLASAEEVARMVAALVVKTERLAPALVPAVELARARDLQASIAQTRVTARMQWRLASAELARVLRLEPTVVMQPVEPPHIRLTLIPPQRNLEEMIPVAIDMRPELSAYQAQVAAAEQRLHQEQSRPFLPTVVLRGASTPTPYPEAFGGFAAGSGGTLGSTGLRSDWDVEAVWELKNLGFGNVALVHERQASLELVRSQGSRYRDIVAKEVTQAWAQMEAADERTVLAEAGLKQAWISATKNLDALGQTKRVAGDVEILVIRPQEVVAAMQSLVQAYFNYYGSIAEFNRSQFRLYRALGNPAQYLQDRDGLLGPPLPCTDAATSLDDKVGAPALQR
jgi:outer membrane protein TolC